MPSLIKCLQIESNAMKTKKPKKNNLMKLINCYGILIFAGINMKNCNPFNFDRIYYTRQSK